MLWYRLDGDAHWFVHGTQITLGLILCLLGLLDIGKTSIVWANGTPSEEFLAGTNPMYRLLDSVS